MGNSLQSHWDAVYITKDLKQVSWTQEIPKTSLELIHSFKTKKDAKIIDIGGGDSKLVDYLLEEGFNDITVLDISEEALSRTKNRLGKKSENIKWIVSDINAFEPTTTYDVWHDRATFHFLTTNEQIAKYMEIARNAVSGFIIIGTFSDNGPYKCSGLSVKQYNEETLTAETQNGFDKIKCITEDHITPFDTKQNFLFCSFKRHKV